MDYLLLLSTALWLGILTSISPCPLATNIAAISYIGRQLANRRSVLWAGLLYSLGRTVVYVLLAALVISGLLAIPALSNFLQQYMHQLLGPLLILSGMFVLGLLSFGTGARGASAQLGERAAGHGLWGAFLMGVVFALAFCPTSAALYFGALIPLSIEHGSRTAAPLLYGVGTALPVVVFAFIIAFSAASLGRAFNTLKAVEVWARNITGVLFILTGIWFVLRYVFHLF